VGAYSNLADFHVAQRGQYVAAKQGLIFDLGRGALARQVFLLVALGQVGNGRCGALLDTLGELAQAAAARCGSGLWCASLALLIQAGYVFEQKKKDTAAPSNSLRRPLYDEGDDAELYVHASGNIVPSAPSRKRE
jgi:hypothetical protein